VPELRAAYRLQLTPAFGFARARALVPYLEQLGISHLYLSPVLQARTGSEHGYDVTDPRRVSDALGGEDELRRLAAAGLGVILDIVPNHMCASEENPFWHDEELRTRVFDVDPERGFHRRFFDIDDLWGVRQEERPVFDATHAKILELVRDGIVDGVRVDHPDGLADPAQYFGRLADAGARHVWAEKILTPGEELRDWPVEGTTGYEFLNDVMAVCVEPSAEAPLTEAYAAITGDTRTFAEVAAASKLEVADDLFAPELRRLRADVDDPGLVAALASFHVYRTYVQPREDAVAPADREEIGRAHVTERLRRILLLEERGHDDFVVRFQQTTGPLMAKGVEDTALYRYFRLSALNEVGGDPGRFGIGIDAFHAANERRAERFPLHLLTTYTHDTKRSPDARARIVALTWLADRWLERVAAWRAQLDGLDDPREELLVLQTLAGTAPIDGGRLERYLTKALREGKVSSSWLAPDEAHEARVHAYAAQAARLVQADPLLGEVTAIGRHVAAAQLLLKLTVPGVPDVYQGDELEDLSLVDPDNRRPVDWDARRSALARLVDGEAPTEATLKLFLVWKTLGLRAERLELFAGPYEPCELGPGVCAFTRGGRLLVAAAVRPGARVVVPDGWRPVIELPGLALAVRGRSPRRSRRPSA
jgi:(1->4)-alpha-D-glucan 1-alpha-D-glucosylmutase